MKNLKIEEHKNKDFLYKLLCLKLKTTNMRRYKNEKYYVIKSEDNIVYGIARLINGVTKEEKARLINFKNFKLRKKDKRKRIKGLIGIWVSDEIRGKGYGKKLINARAKQIKKGDIIISDVRVTSPLLNYYKEKYKMKEIKKTNTHIYIKNKKYK
jgi:predicted GNAT family acetyltransferase